MSTNSNSPNVQCSMRMSARSNPPTSPQYALAPPGPAKCLDISTVRSDLFIHPLIISLTLIIAVRHRQMAWKIFLRTTR